MNKLIRLAFLTLCFLFNKLSFANLHVYLAGPDVFTFNGKQIGELKKKILKKNGFIGHYALDATIKNYKNNPRTAYQIAKSNEAFMQKSQVILVNMSPWHGPSLDVGTAFEAGYMSALAAKDPQHILIIGYYETPTPKTYYQRITDAVYHGNVHRNAQGALIGSDGSYVEAFGLHDNVMIEGAIHKTGGKVFYRFEDAVNNIQKLYTDKRHYPVSELHVHADAGILNETLFNQLAKRNKLSLNASQFYKHGIIYHKPGDFLDFLRVYDLVSSVIQTKQDITDVIYDYLRRSHDHGAIYTELMISPEHFNQKTVVYTKPGQISAPIRQKGLSYQAVVHAVAKGIDKAKYDFGIESRMLIVILRHKGPESANQLLETIIQHPHPYVKGINLAGDDIHYPAVQFRDLYKKAQQHGLHTSAHIGEHTGPKDIQLAMSMHLERIGHGLSVIQNKTLMATFKQSGIGIEVCPSSNIDGGNGKFKTMLSHPLKIMLNEGLFVSISTDDPSFLHTNIQNEYKLVQNAYHLSDKQMLRLCENSIRMSFAESKLKHQLLKKIRAYKISISST